MKKVCLLILSFVLVACTSEELKSLDDFILSNNLEQEQNISSKLPSSNKINWKDKNFPKNCEWYELERVVDGDTIIVRDGQTRIRVRMIGIDTPESKKEGTKIQPYALKAGSALKEFLEKEDEVCLLGDKVGDDYDIYARKLSYVFTKSGKDLNAEMLKIGLARGYFYFAFERKEEFRQYFQQAKDLKVGMWE